MSVNNCTCLVLHSPTNNSCPVPCMWSCKPFEHLFARMKPVLWDIKRIA